MPSTPVRDIELIEVGSLGKETLSNDSFTNLSLGISGAATIPLASTDVTLTEGTDGQAQHFVLILVGTLTANVNLIVPAESRVYVVDNRTTGAFTVTCRPAAGGGVAVDQSARTLIYCDGTTVYPVASGTGGGGGGSGAPTDASYLVGTGHALLSGERVVTNTPTISWDLTTAGQAKAFIPADAVSYAHIQNVASARLLGRFAAGSGDVQEITPGTGLTLDAGTGVLSATAVGQPLDATLTALAGLATGANQVPYSTGTDTFSQTPLTAFARTVLDDADAATVRGTISAQASDATLTALAGVTTGADTLPFFTGVDTASTTTLTAFMRGLLDDPDLATAQTTLGITGGGGYTDEQAQDAVGAMLQATATIALAYADVTPALTAAVVAGSIGTTQLADDSVTYAKLQNVTDARLLGRSAGSAGDAQEITVGTGLTLASGTLTASGGGADTETIQDIVGGMLTSSTTIALAYSDAAGSITATVQADSIHESYLTFIDVTTDNATTGKHGLLPKLSGTATQYLNGSGAWTTPAGSGQPLDATLTAIAGLTTAADRVPFFTGVDIADLATFTAAGRTLVGAADAAAQRTALTLGTMAQQDANAVAITGGTLIADYLRVNNRAGTPVEALHLNIVSGTGRFNVYAPGTAQNLLTGITGFMANSAAPATNVQVHVAYPKASRYGIQIQPTDQDTGSPAIRFANTGGGECGTITTTTTTTAYNTSSDPRLKEDVHDLTDALATLLALRPVAFRWRADHAPGHGFLATEVQQVVPEAVSGEPDAVDDDGQMLPMGIDHSKLVVWVVAAVQDLAAQVQALAARLDAAGA